MKIDRLVSIIMILLEKKRVSAHELAKQFEISVRTVYRDMEAIMAAGIPVRSIPGVSGGFEIMPQFKVDRMTFSMNDLCAMLTGLTGLSSMIHGDELSHAIAKVRSFIPAEQAKEIARKTSQTAIDIHAWTVNRSIQDNLERIRNAMEEHQLISFDYISHRGNTSSRSVEPCQLVLKDSQWYIYGFCRTRNDFRIFRLSRMLRLYVSGERFEPRDFPPPKLALNEEDAPGLMEIKIRIHSSIMDRVLDFCPYEHFTPDGNEHYIVKFPFIDNDYFYDLLLGFGSKCECLAPQSIRENMMRRVQELSQLYGM